MATVYTSHTDTDELGGGRRRTIIGLRARNVLRAGRYVPQVCDYADSGDGAWPFTVEGAGLRLRVAPDHTLRILPLVDHDDVYADLSSPYIRKAGGGWQQPPLGTLSRSANVVTATSANVNTYVWHAGHFIKPAWLLKAGWRPIVNGDGRPDFAFKVGMSGLTRAGGVFSYGGVPVMSVRAPIAYNYDDPSQTWVIPWDFIQLNGDWYVHLVLPAETDGITRIVVDPTLTLQPAAADGQDSPVVQGAPTFNYGIATTAAFSTTQKGLLKFNVSAIPAHARCSAATLTVYQASTGAAQAFTCTVYSIAAGNAAWIEGTKNGALAGAGEPCWNALAADGAGGVTTAWAGSAGLSTAGTDYEAVAIASFNGSRSDANGTAYPAVLTTARVRGWISSGTNYGMVFWCNVAGGAAGMSDHATAAWRPQLAVNYSLPGGMVRHGARWI